MPPERYSHIDFSPPAGVRKAAARALKLREEQTPSNRGGTRVGVTRAGQLARGATLSPETIKRMVSFFARHAVDREATGFRRGEAGYPSKGRQAWELWGGDAGRRWARKVRDQMKTADEKD